MSFVPGRAARISAVPTRKPSAPAALARETASAVCMPDSAMRTQPFEEGDVRREVPEVPAVDADDLRAARDRARDLLRVVRLHKGLHPERPREAEEVRECRVVQHRRDQQNGVRARGARGGHLVARRDEVLVEDRDLRIAAHVRQIAFVAEETVRLAQD